MLGGKIDKKDIIFITVLFLLIFYTRTLPNQDNPLPYGEGDAAHKYGNADWMVWLDSAQRRAPTYYAFWYGSLNAEDMFAPTYPIPFFIDMAALHIWSGERFLAKNIWIAIMMIFPFALGVYFLVSRLYNFTAAAIASLLLITSYRNIISLLWGQRMVLLGHGFIPIALYCYYQFIESILAGKKKYGYLIVTGMLLGFAGFAHPMSLIVGIFPIAVYTIYIFFKYKKEVMNWNSMKGIIILVLVFLFVFGPFLVDLIRINPDSVEFGLKIQHPQSLFVWYFANEDNVASTYGYANDNWGYWSLPFLLLGILYVGLRHRRKDIFMLSWLVGLYIVLHLDVLNLKPYMLTRSLLGTPAIFYSLMGIGVAYSANLLRTNKNVKTIFTLILIVTFGTLAYVNAYSPSVAMLKNAYQGPLRITPAQLDVVDWIDHYVENESTIFIVGTLTYPKVRFMHMLSHRSIQPTSGGDQMRYNFDEAAVEAPGKFTHVLVDYSDYVMIGNKNAITALQTWEQNFAENDTIGEKSVIYNKNNIRLYKLKEPYGNPKFIWPIFLKQ